MAIGPTTDEMLADLKERLQTLTPGQFEKVAAALVSEHLDVGIAVAKSGFQYGADAGPSGRRDRRFRIETKRYADNTNLSDREILGEIDDALGLDPALEAWFLVATRPAPEQLEQKLLRKSDETGVPIVVIDWKTEGFPALAALCTAAPSVLDHMVSIDTGDLARALESDGHAALISLTRDLEAWNLGFDRLRQASHAKLKAIWGQPRVSQSELGQDAAGGAHAHMVLGHEVTFVERSRLEFGEAVAQLLEPGSLAQAIDVLELAALRVAILRRNDDWEYLKWICLLNHVDFAETAAALRARADAVLRLTPEPGVAAWLPARVGSLMLWLSGDEDLEALAVERNPDVDRGLDYEADYLNDPANSMIALERRHVDQTLLDHRLPLRRRIDRAKGFWTDYRLEPPASFVHEMRQALQSIDVSTLDRGEYHSIEDHNFGEITPAAARLVPDALAALHRRKLTGLPDRDDAARSSAAVRSTEQLLLVDDEVRAAAREVRMAPIGPGVHSESDVRSRMVLIELLDLPAVERVDHILQAGLSSVYSDYGDLLLPLSEADVDALVLRYCDAASDTVSQLLMLFAMAQAPIGDTSWDWILGRVNDPDEQRRGIAMRLLYESDARRLGRTLAADGWHWTGGTSLWIDHFGSLALTAATIGIPFDQVAPSLAPWLLPRAVAMRGGSPEDVDIATSILRHVVEAPAPEPLDPGSAITIVDQRRAEDPAAVTITIYYGHEDGLLGGLKAAMDADVRREIREKAVETAKQRIEQVRMEGASLHMRDFGKLDLLPFIAHAPAVIDAWLEGMEEPTADFRRRVLRSEGLFVALCEALLERDPLRGEMLWLALRQTLSTRFVSEGGVDKLIHIAFRMQDCPETIRQRVLSDATTDHSLFDVVLAASMNGGSSWLSAMVEADASSGVTWRLQRGRMMQAFDPCWDGGVPEWPVGPAESLRVSRIRAADAWVRRGAFARHWWDAYWTVEEDDDAFAAWTLLLSCIDRRGHVWMRTPDDAASRVPRRLAHFRANRDELQRAMKSHEKNLDKEFLGRKIKKAVGPWRTS